mmetsp:Transcript_476/g.628  ORF Transcript_476/g.628 Transcript_476/m.628 type:complete len:433 (-) Transcript_476:171-1469(-)
MDLGPPLPSLSRQNSSQRAAQAAPIWSTTNDTEEEKQTGGDASIDLNKPPPLPPSMKKQTTIDRANACESIWDEYITAIEDVDGQFQPMENLAAVSHYKEKAEGSEPTPEMMKRLMRELQRELPKDLVVSSRASMFVRFDEEEPRFLRAVLIGVEDTPYANGVFLFDVFVPADYPNTNCLVKHITPGASVVYGDHTPGGFSPNLHRDTGKVCLSLLGTWDGPGWNPENSNIYQVLSSILWMILGAEHPYYMEPGFGGWEGTAPTSDFEKEAIDYEEEIRYSTAKIAILDVLRNPFQGFEDAIKAHFRMKRKLIISTIQSWIDKGSDSLKERLAPVLDELILEFESQLSVQDAEEEVALAEEGVEFVRRKMDFLRKKCLDAGPNCRKIVPKAYKRLRMGPKLLEEALEKLEKAQITLAEAQKREAAMKSSEIP